jgi:hypothetical protein
MSDNVRRQLLACAVAAVTTLGILGCNDEDDAAPVAQPAAPQSTPGPSARQTTPPPAPAAEPTGTAAPTADDEPARQVESAPPPTPPTEATPPPAAQPQPPPQTPTPRAPQQQQQQQPPPAAAAANTPQAKARALLDQLVVQKGQAKWAEGEKTLQELEKLKGSLPRDMRDEIEAERSSFKAAKAIWGQDR